MSDTVKIRNPYKRKRANETCAVDTTASESTETSLRRASTNESKLFLAPSNSSSKAYTDSVSSANLKCKRDAIESSLGVPKESQSDIGKTTFTQNDTDILKNGLITSTIRSSPTTGVSPANSITSSSQDPGIPNRQTPSSTLVGATALNKKLKHNLPISSTRLVSKGSSSACALVISAANKAGMDGIDRELIDKIILEESGDSLFMQQQRRRDEKVNKKIAQLQEKLQQQHRHEPNWISSFERTIDRDEIPKLLSARPCRSCKVVIDMDMFYMACELLTRPDLAAINDQQPACVGGTSMISTSNYAARRFGVRAAMPGYIGKKLVERISKGQKTLVFCRPNYTLYKQKSSEVMNILKEYDPLHLKSYGLDEAYLDLGPYLACKLARIEQNHCCDHQDILSALANCSNDKQQQSADLPEVNSSQLNDIDWADTDTIDEILSFHSSKSFLEVASCILNDMRAHVFKATGLTCSAGLASNFLIAKIASDCNKPNGQKIVDASHEAITEFLYPLPIRKVSGIGRVTEKILKSFGIATVDDLYKERALVRFLFQTNGSKECQAAFLLKASVGCTSSDGKETQNEEPGSEDIHQKGISRERTFQPGKSWVEVNSKLEEIGLGLSKDMQRKDVWARTLTLKVKLHTFDCFTRSRTMPIGVYLQTPAADLIKVATDMLRELKKEYVENAIKNQKKKPSADPGMQFSVRLLGIRCNNFKGDDEKYSENSKQINIKRFFQPTTVEDTSLRSSPSISGTATSAPIQFSNTASLCSSIEFAKEGESFHIAGLDKSSTVGALINAVADGHVKAASPEYQRKTKIDLKPKNTVKGSQAFRNEEPEDDHPSIPVNCPVCGVTICAAASDNLTINQHIDSCLSGAAIRRVVREDATTCDHNKERRLNNKRRRSLIDFFCGKD